MSTHYLPLEKVQEILEALTLVCESDALLIDRDTAKIWQKCNRARAIVKVYLMPTESIEVKVTKDEA